MSNPLIGKKVERLMIAADRQALRFDLEGGKSILVRVGADCCSTSWVEHVENLDALIGGTVVSVEDVDLPDDPARVCEHKNCGSEYGHEVLAFYACKITTEKGTALIDYRNDSNGYYGGSLSWPPDGYFCGGVHGQNVSKEEWREATEG